MTGRPTPTTTPLLSIVMIARQITVVGTVGMGNVMVRMKHAMMATMLPTVALLAQMVRARWLSVVMGWCGVLMVEPRVRAKHRSAVNNEEVNGAEDGLFDVALKIAV